MVSIFMDGFIFMGVVSKFVDMGGKNGKWLENFRVCENRKWVVSISISTCRIKGAWLVYLWIFRYCCFIFEGGIKGVVIISLYMYMC